jgi:KaiC/GvpD/RAD55 family RecA-like ATPase
MSHIEIIKHKKLPLDIPIFTCDGSINDTLNLYPMLSNLNGFKFTCLIGKPGMGKTSVLISFLTSKKVFKKVFHRVVIIMPTSSRNSMKKNPFKKHLPERMHDELDLSTLNKIYDDLLESSEAKETTLLVMDDVGAALKNNDIQKLLRKIIYNRRHLKVHIIMLVQSYLSVPRELRKLVNNVIMFKPSKVESEILLNELFEYSKNDTLSLIKYAYTKPHDYIMLNVDNQKIYKDYNELIIKNNLSNYNNDSSEED